MTNYRLDLQQKLRFALQSRYHLLDQTGNFAWRLFNGFLEGDPRWVIEVFGTTLVIHDYLDEGEADIHPMEEMLRDYQTWLPWLKTGLYKHRYADDIETRRGKIVFGNHLSDEITETGVRYAINLRLNQDSSFYLDTKNLRTWLLNNMHGKTLLNTFAYTGSLGVAALEGGARQVTQVDLNRRFMDLSKKSCELNHLPAEKLKNLVGDFYKAIGHLKKARSLYDCVILDPPYFSTTDAGRVDLVNQSARLINKVKPLVAHQGYLVVVNNALFLSGKAFIGMLSDLCQDGYLKVVTTIPVPEDLIGYDQTIVSQPPVPVAPFNHSTKIVILQVKRKDQLPAS